MADKIIERNISFFDFWAAFYDYGPLSWWLRGMQNVVLSQIRFKPKAKILDIGCGTGRGLFFLFKKGFKSLAGIDLSPLMAQKAKNLLGKNAVIKIASVDNIPFENNEFDVVTNTEAFHHFPNPAKAVKEMYRVLKPNGMLYLADLNFFFKTIHWLFKKFEPGHVKIYSKEEFNELFLKAGFKVVSQKRVYWFVILTVGKK